MKPKSDILQWNINQIADALKISSEDVKAYFTDGRRVSFILERRLSSEVVGGTLAPSEGAGYDLLDKTGGKWEVRSISKRGIYFSPSYMVGSGRSFDEAGFLSKLEEIKGYIVSDITKFPNIPYWIIPVDIILKWWRQNELGTTTKVSRVKALKLIDEL